MICYDVETLRGPLEVTGGWNNPEAMGFGCAVSYDTKDKRHRFYMGEAGRMRLVDHLKDREVLGFNSARFDRRVVLGNKGQPMWHDIDLLEAVIYAKYGMSIKRAEDKFGVKAVHDGSVNLNALAKKNLGVSKCGAGEHAPVLIRAGRWDMVYEYCCLDVDLTWWLYEHSLHNPIVDGHGHNYTIEWGVV